MPAKTSQIGLLKSTKHARVLRKTSHQNLFANKSLVRRSCVLEVIPIFNSPIPPYLATTTTRTTKNRQRQVIHIKVQVIGSGFQAPSPSIRRAKKYGVCAFSPFVYMGVILTCTAAKRKASNATSLSLVHAPVPVRGLDYLARGIPLLVAPVITVSRSLANACLLFTGKRLADSRQVSSTREVFNSDFRQVGLYGRFLRERIFIFSMNMNFL